jgi:hypothetical protein
VVSESRVGSLYKKRHKQLAQNSLNLVINIILVLFNTLSKDRALNKNK